MTFSHCTGEGGTLDKSVYRVVSQLPNLILSVGAGILRKAFVTQKILMWLIVKVDG